MEGRFHTEEVVLQYHICIKMKVLWDFEFVLLICLCLLENASTVLNCLNKNYAFLLDENLSVYIDL